MIKSLKWILLCITTIGVYTLMSYDKNDINPLAVNPTTNIISEFEKPYNQKSSSFEINTKNYPEKIISNINDTNNKKIVNYDSVPGDIHKLSYIYKWKDSNKTIILSSEPPPANIIHETFYFKKTDATPLVPNEVEMISNGKIRISKSISDNPLRVYTPDGLRELIKQSKDIGETLELRGKLLDDIYEML